MNNATYTGHDFLFDVGHDLLPVLALARRFLGDEIAQVAGFHGRSDPPLADRLHVLGDVVDHLATPLTKFLAVHDVEYLHRAPREMPKEEKTSKDQILWIH